MTLEEPRERTADEDGIPICPNCASENPSNAPYCPKCGMPIGMFSTTDPMQAIYSQGWAYRRAATGRSNALAFWGMWLIFGPAAAGVILALIDLASFGEEVSILGLGLSVAIGALYIAVLYRVTRNYIRQRRYKAGYCGVCRYQLRGLVEPRCPECGTPFDPDLLDAAGDDPPA